jgi:hypothetical protein
MKRGDVRLLHHFLAAHGNFDVVISWKLLDADWMFEFSSVNDACLMCLIMKVRLLTEIIAPSGERKRKARIERVSIGTAKALSVELSIKLKHFVHNFN